MELAHDVAVRQKLIRPGLGPTDPRVLDGILQFDIVANLAAMANADSLSQSLWYCGFAFWDGRRTAPILADLVSNDGALAEFLGTEVDADFVADAIRAMDEAAYHQAFMVWHGFENPRLRAFLAAHPPRR